MKSNNILSNHKNFPKPSDAEQVELYFAKLSEKAQKPDDIKEFFENTLSKKPETKLLNSIFGNSPYLSKALIKEIEFFKTIYENGFENSFDELISNLKTESKNLSNIDQIMACLRIAKLRVSLLIAIADIIKYWTLETITAKLSEFAETAVKITINFILRDANKNNEIKLEDLNNPEEDSGLIILAMGKLGAKELNYSSDIDLIVLFDEEKIKYTGKKTVKQFYIGITQDLVKIMQNRTKDGYVFRTDLRLRPDPSSTPAAISVKAAEIYYETLGQNWERAAMIKARPIAGDEKAGKHFMDFISLYIWRRSLDFASIQDIHSIKRQIDSKQGKLPKNLYSYNVKLGRGGIREIEFFAQTQQLIWGGRRPALRKSSTCEALKALVESKEITQEICNNMVSAYRFLRDIEHRLQMIEDQQTHTLPSSQDKMKSFAIFMGFKNSKDFITKLTNTITEIQSYYSQLFETSPSLASTNPDIDGSLVFTGSENDPETLETLNKMGFSNSEQVSEIIRGWHHGRYRATRTKRAREILTELMPVLISAFANTSEPDISFTKFDEFLSKLPSGVQIFSLFYSNPNLLDLIADIMGGYPYIAKNLSTTPALLDYVLAPEFYTSLPDKESLLDGLKNILEKNAKDMQDALIVMKNWAHDRQFRIGVQLIKHEIILEDAAVILSNIADSVISLLLKYIEEDFAEQYGKLPNSKFAIVALGKLGGQELTFGSDLDLVFIYEAEDENASSDGKTALPTSQYFARLSRRFMNAISSLTREGKLYEVDLRLRPSGNSGPIASSLDAFDKYYGTSAWAWEYMVLTRARVVAAPKEFGQKVISTIRQKLQKEWDHKKLKRNILDMHDRATRHHQTDNIFDVKYITGGLVDLEYISQFLQLRNAQNHSEILDANTKHSFEKLCEAGVINKKTKSSLIDASILYSNIQSTLRLTGKENPLEKDLKEGIKKTLANNTQAKDFKDLKKKLVRTQKKVQKLFEDLIS